MGFVRLVRPVTRATALPACVVAGLAMSCVIQPLPPEPPPAQTVEMAPVEPAHVPEPEVAVAPEIPQAVEFGYEHCCGDDRYRLEIGCGYMEMRCYRRGLDGGWIQTFGRHCKEQLGDGCYLNGCDDRCQ